MILQDIAKKSLYKETKKQKKQITINIDSDTVDYYKVQADNTGIPYQTLINLYLSECAVQEKQLEECTLYG